jgi:hypothetical protein
MPREIAATPCTKPRVRGASLSTLVLGIAATALCACDSRDTVVYTLYRTSQLTPIRIHVATFDVQGEAETYNRGNCEMVVKYLTEQPEVPDGYYWCEPGRFRPES